jgi:hypothetical protein
MEKSVRRWVVLFTIFAIFTIGLGIASGDEYFMLTGKVVGMYKNQLTVKSDKGQTMYFVTGRSTVFVPTREPNVDERVKVTYYSRRGENVATQVEILSAKK